MKTEQILLNKMVQAAENYNVDITKTNNPEDADYNQQVLNTTAEIAADLGYTPVVSYVGKQVSQIAVGEAKAPVRMNWNGPAVEKEES